MSISKTLQMGMNPKKIHEVSHMAAVIAEEHEGQDSSLVVDVGSGLVCCFYSCKYTDSIITSLLLTLSVRGSTLDARI